jgi:small subunit ribosomal protein S9
MAKKEEKTEEKFWQAIGRRKTSVAQVKIFESKEKVFLVNEKPLETYFPLFEMQKIVKSPLELVKCENKFKILAKVQGGGVNSQAEAIRHAISRALVLYNPNFRKKLKKAGFLKRDQRVKERKKPGLKRARRAPQWQKR